MIYIYIYIYRYNLFVLYCMKVSCGYTDDMVSTFCCSKDNDYTIIHSSSLFISSVIADCDMYLYIYRYIGTIRWYYACCLFVVYIVYSMQLVLYCMVNQWERYNNYCHFLPLSFPYCCWLLYMMILVQRRNDNNGLLYVGW